MENPNNNSSDPEYLLNKIHAICSLNTEIYERLIKRNTAIISGKRYNLEWNAKKGQWDLSTKEEKKSASEIFQEMFSDMHFQLKKKEKIIREIRCKNLGDVPSAVKEILLLSNSIAKDHQALQQVKKFGEEIQVQLGKLEEYTREKPTSSELSEEISQINEAIKTFHEKIQQINSESEWMNYMKPYRYYKLKIIATRNGDPPQLHRITFQDEKDTPVVPTSARSNHPPQGQHECAQNLILNTGYEKWYAGQNTGFPGGLETLCPIDFGKYDVSIVFDFGEEVAVKNYQFTTANDVPSRDPSGWIWYGSTNSQEWKELSKVSQILPPFGRYSAYSLAPLRKT